ncbi:cerato-platanin-like secreted protein [Trametes punicea]|nr:cerato-platanin-like secreted protein [Trametes punicea]
MQFFAILISALSLAAATLGAPNTSGSGTSTWQVTFDPVFDNKSNSLNKVACSNGHNGLESKGYTTFGSLPDQWIGGVQAIAGWNSPNCGTCWQISYNNVTINMLAVDHTDSGVNVGEVAMNKFTNGHAVQRGVIHAHVKEVDPSNCGFGRK